MEFKSAKIDGVNILVPGILYTRREYRRIVTSDESQNIEGFHGRNTSPTFARYRIITIEGVIDRMEWVDNDTRLSHLESLFAFQTQLLKVQPKTLTIVDIYDREWEIEVKVKDALEVLEGDETMEWSHWRWRVVLESVKSPIMRSTIETQVSWEEWNFWGFELDMELWEAWDEFFGIITIEASPNTTDTRWRISARENLEAPLEIINITQNTRFIIGGTILQWDIIELDSKELTLSKNGVNILADRFPGSVWPRIAWVNDFVVQDKNGAMDGVWLDVDVYFYKTQL